MGEAIGLVDSKLETVGVFAKATEKDSPKAVVEETGESMRSETEQSSEDKNGKSGEAEKESGSEESSAELPHTPKEGEDYGKGVIFYLRESTVVGVLLWNVFAKMGVARKIIRESKTYDDLSDFAKLFELHTEAQPPPQ